MPRIARRTFLQALAPAALLPATSSKADAVRVAEIQTYVLKDAFFVRAVGDNGISGWGECDAGNPKLMQTFVETGLTKHVIGRPIWDAEPVWDTMFYRNHDLGPGGGLANAIAGVDIALWDLRGRTLGVPVYQLLGGMFRDRIRAYGSFGVDFGRSMSPEQAGAQAAKFVRLGFTAVKLRMQIRENNQNPDPDPTFAYAAAVRRAIGEDIDFLIDLNNGYSAARAIEVARRLRQEFNILFLEEPVSDQTHHETAAVARAVDPPVIAGEKEYTRWQHRELITLASPDILNPDPIKAGGITETKKIAAIAEAYGKPILLHNTRPTLSTAAALHIIASIPNCAPLVEYVDLDRFATLLSLMKNRLRFENGHLHVPETEGLGLDVDTEAVRKAARS